MIDINYWLLCLVIALISYIATASLRRRIYGVRVCVKDEDGGKVFYRIKRGKATKEQ